MMPLYDVVACAVPSPSNEQVLYEALTAAQVRGPPCFDYNVASLVGLMTAQPSSILYLQHDACVDGISRIDLYSARIYPSPDFSYMTLIGEHLIDGLPIRERSLINQRTRPNHG